MQRITIPIPMSMAGSAARLFGAGSPARMAQASRSVARDGSGQQPVVGSGQLVAARAGGPRWMMMTTAMVLPVVEMASDAGMTSGLTTVGQSAV